MSSEEASEVKQRSTSALQKNLEMYSVHMVHKFENFSTHINMNYAVLKEVLLMKLVKFIIAYSPILTWGIGQQP